MIDRREVAVEAELDARARLDGASGTADDLDLLILGQLVRAAWDVVVRAELLDRDEELDGVLGYARLDDLDIGHTLLARGVGLHHIAVRLAAHSTGWALDPVGELDLDLDVGRDLEGDATARSGYLIDDRLVYEDSGCLPELADLDRALACGAGEAQLGLTHLGVIIGLYVDLEGLADLASLDPGLRAGDLPGSGGTA